jgi:hypothetical protein
VILGRGVDGDISINILFMFINYLTLPSLAYYYLLRLDY